MRAHIQHSRRIGGRRRSWNVLPVRAPAALPLPPFSAHATVRIGQRSGQFFAHHRRQGRQDHGASLVLVQHGDQHVCRRFQAGVIRSPYRERVAWRPTLVVFAGTRVGQRSAGIDREETAPHTKDLV